MNPLRGLISAYRAAFSGLPREVWLLAGGLLITRAGTMVLPFLSLYLTRDLGLTAAAAGSRTVRIQFECNCCPCLPAASDSWPSLDSKDPAH